MAQKCCVHSVSAGAEGERNCKCKTKKNCPLFCQHERWYSTLGISNIHSKADAGTVQLNECCGQYMKGLNTTNAKILSDAVRMSEGFFFFFWDSKRKRIPLQRFTAQSLLSAGIWYNEIVTYFIPPKFLLNCMLFFFFYFAATTLFYH